METEYDRTGESHCKVSHSGKIGIEEPLMPEAASCRDDDDSPGHDGSTRPGQDFILDDRLTSAAAPFLYMLSTVLIAVAGYFVYLFFHG